MAEDTINCTVLDADAIAKPKETYSRNGIQEINLVNISFNPVEEPASPMEMEPQKMTLRNPPSNLYRVITICVWMLICGGSDATPGAILPDLEDYYDVSYGVASMIWLGNAVGFILVACNSHKLDAWFDYRSCLLVGCSFSVLMYSIVSSGTKFPAIVVGFMFGGIGMAIVLAKVNLYLARFKSSKYLSIAQSCYGLGATVAPLIATSFIGAGIQWNFFYIILLALVAGSFISIFIAFKNANDDLAAFEKDETEDQAIVTADTTALLKIALKNKVTWLLALFVFFYQGSEVSMGGWIVTYLLDYRNGGHVVGYVASGFWGGVTLGRLLLARPLHKAIGARRSVIVCSVSALVSIVLTWVIPNVIGAGVFVSIAGFFVGPNYPILISVTTDFLPRKIQIISLTIATAFGSAGGAFFPFLVGLISQQVGAFVVLPGFLILYSIMLVLWIALPNQERVKRGESMKFWWQRIW